jgi:hypothetical protein
VQLIPIEPTDLALLLLADCQTTGNFQHPSYEVVLYSINTKVATLASDHAKHPKEEFTEVDSTSFA